MFVNIACPSGFEEFKGKCYKVLPGKDNWKGAQSKCKTEGGYLMNVNNDFDKEALEEFAPQLSGYFLFNFESS